MTSIDDDDDDAFMSHIPYDYTPLCFTALFWGLKKNCHTFGLVSTMYTYLASGVAFEMA